MTPDTEQGPDCAKESISSAIGRRIRELPLQDQQQIAKDIEARHYRIFNPPAAGMSNLNVLGGAGASYNYARNQARPPAERITLDNIEDLLSSNIWTPDQVDAGTAVREALLAAARAILRHAPDSPFRSVALRDIVNARMNANAAISYRGRF